MEPAVVDGNGTETGHIIVTTIGGRNGQPKQVNLALRFCIVLNLVNLLSLFIDLYPLVYQTISYMAERIVGQGSFGVVFQVLFVVAMKEKL